MKHLKLFENFDKKSYYEFDAIKFYNDFKKVFNNEKYQNIDNFRSTNFFKTLDNLLPTWSTIPLDNTIEEFVKNILQDKFVSFYDLAEEVNSGKVRKVKFFYSVFFKEFTYSIDIGGLSKYGYAVKYSIPIRIYNSKKTKIEKLVDLYMTRNKFNI